MILKRCYGVLAHPTSFPSPYGIGDLGYGAYDFIDFLKQSKAALWQILPLGPTSFGDSPYQSFSTFAGNPLLISPDLLVKDGLLTEDELNIIPDFDCSKVDYGEVINFKEKIFRKAFANLKDKKTAPLTREYDIFCENNAYWLNDYALFVSLKTHFINERRNTIDSPEFLEYKRLNLALLTENEIKDNFYGAVWNTWPHDIKFRHKKMINTWVTSLTQDIEYHTFLQFVFYKQWFALKKYAGRNDIKIIGDIPIFVAMDSADVWSNPELYRLDEYGYPVEVAGVPPDYFSKTGQLWGNPLYDWDMHRQTDYEWWIKRIEFTVKNVDIVRIDHFRGFDEYWAVPYVEDTAINGKWRKGPGKDIFIEIKKALGALPVIAEDLGIITKTVRDLRDELKLPGMRVLQFAFGDGPKNLYLPHSFDCSNSVVYTGTHDNNTTRGWYSEIDEQTRDHFRRYMNVSGDNITWDLIRMAFATVGAFAIVPIQDIMFLGSNARMNTPGIAQGNWQFRYTKDMLNTHEFSQKLIYLADMFNRILDEETAR